MEINKTTVLFKLEHEIMAIYGYDFLHRFRLISQSIKLTEAIKDDASHIENLNLNLRNKLHEHPDTTEIRLWLEDNLDEESYIKVIINHVIPDMLVKGII